MKLPAYTKIPISYKDQAKLLISRGMSGDVDYIEGKLRTVNYYRLSAYWFSAWEINEDGTHKDIFKSGTNFKTVWERYAFDRRLRLCIMDAIERIEIGNENFYYSKVLILDGLYKLELFKIGSNSFTQLKQSNWDWTKADNKSKSFHILNCESLESIQIGTFGSTSYNFYFSSFVLRGIDMILNI